MSGLDMSKVWFADAKVRNYLVDSLEMKGRYLFDEAGLQDCFGKGDRVAVKIHWGDNLNTGYLRPNLIRGIVDKVKEHGGRPFVVEGTSLGLHSWRGTSLDYLEVAAAHGFTPETMGCPVEVADGWAGLDDVEVEVPEGKIIKKTYVARSIATADALILVTHFKGHGMGGFGGAIKNLGIGCVSKRGKYLAHAGPGFEKAVANPAECPGKACPYHEYCQTFCFTGAIKITDRGLEFDESKCIYCSAACICPSYSGTKAIQPPRGRDEHGWVLHERTQARYADNALAVVKAVGRDHVGYVTFMIDVSPQCDCACGTDLPIVPNIGVFASKDPVSIDQACYDKMVEAPGLPWSKADGMGPGVDKLSKIHGFDVTVQLQVGEEIGLGSRRYEIVTPPPLPKTAVLELWPWREKCRQYRALLRAEHPLMRLLPQSDPYFENLRTVKA
jgi:uncharacterized Fe-S center protein